MGIDRKGCLGRISIEVKVSSNLSFLSYSLQGNYLARHFSQHITETAWTRLSTAPNSEASAVCCFANFSGIRHTVGCCAFWHCSAFVFLQATFLHLIGPFLDSFVDPPSSIWLPTVWSVSEVVLGFIVFLQSDLSVPSHRVQYQFHINKYLSN